VSAFKRAQIVGAQLAGYLLSFRKPADDVVATDIPETPLEYATRGVELVSAVMIAQDNLELKDDQPPQVVVRARLPGSSRVELVRASLYSEDTLASYTPFVLPVLVSKVVVPATLTFELVKGDTELPALFFQFQFVLRPE